MKHLFATLILIAMHSPVALAAKSNLQPQASKIEFEAVGRPSMMKVKGTGGTAKGSLTLENEQVVGVLKLDLTQLKTGIDLRDEHMKDKYLEVKKHPEATLTLNPVSVPKGWELGQELNEQAFTGKLSLHGVEKPIAGQFSINSDKAVTAKFEIKLSDFKIDIPSYLGVTIADMVKVQTQFVAKAE